MSSWEKKSKAEAKKKRDKERKAKFAAAWEKTKVAKVEETRWEGKENGNKL
jgi:hypothetical protein